MPEPLHIFLAFLSLLWLTGFLETGRPSLLALTAISTSLAILTRYVGISLVITACAGILTFRKIAWRRRLLEAGILGVIALLTLGLWLAWNVAIADTSVNREWSFHPMRYDLLRLYVTETVTWLIPRSLRIILRYRLPLAGGGALLTLMPLYVQEIKERLAAKERLRAGRGRSLPWIPLLYILTHILVLVGNSTVIDAGTTASAPARYLAPVFAASVILFICAGYRLVTKPRLRKAPAVLALAASVGLIGLYGLDSLELLRSPLQNMGYLGFAITQTETMDGLQAIDPQRAVISNIPELVYILSGRPAYARPIRFDSHSLQEREDLAEQVASARVRLESGAVLVIFGDHGPEDRELSEGLGLAPLLHFGAAVFYGYPGAAVR